MFDVLAQTPTWIAYALAVLGAVGLMGGLFMISATRPKTRARRVSAAFTLLAGLATATALTVHAQQEEAKWEAVTAAVNEKYGIDLSVEQVSGLTANSADWLTVDGDRVACVFEYTASNLNSAEPVVESVHLVCGEELAVAG
jgi:hypothetical protein